MGESQGPWTQLLVTVITVAGVAVIVWMEAPPWQREAMRRVLRLRVRQAAGHPAARGGHRAMGDELRGRAGGAAAGHGVTDPTSPLPARPCPRHPGAPLAGSSFSTTASACHA